MARALAVGAAVAVSLLAVSGAGGAALQQTPKRGGTVVVAIVNPEPACLNVVLLSRCAPGSAGGGLFAALQVVLEAPFDTGTDFTWHPRLVSKVDYTRSRPFTLTYHIRPEARWSDGVPVTVRDFRFTLRALRTLDPGLRKFHSAIRGIRRVDAKTFTIVLRPRFAEWRSYFGNVLPAHVLEGTDLTKVWTDAIDNPKTGRPIGSGPFLVERLERGRQLVLRRNPRFWGSHRAYVDRLVVRFGVDGNTLQDGFREETVDVAGYGFPTSFLSNLRRESGLRILTASSVGWDHFLIRRGPQGHPALQNKLVRRALAFGIDRNALVRQLWSDIDPGLTPSQSAVYVQQSPYYRPNWRQYSFRPDEARRLLERAGCSRGADGIYSCGGERLSLRFSSPAIPGSFRARVLEIVAPQLRRAGFELIPEFAHPTVFFNLLPRGDFEVAIFGWTSGGPSPFGKDIYGCGAPLNYSGYCSRLVTADLDQAQRILDADQQARAVNRADARMAKDVPVIPLYQRPDWVAVRSNLRGFVMAPKGAPSALAGAENWWLDR